MYPQTRYAQSHGGDVAYQVIGEGPVDLEKHADTF